MRDRDGGRGRNETVVNAHPLYKELGVVAAEVQAIMSAAAWKAGS